MTRVLHREINNCSECPLMFDIFLDSFFCRGLDNENEDRYIGDRKQVTESVPDWCPLPTLEEYQKKSVEKNKKKEVENDHS